MSATGLRVLHVNTHDTRGGAAQAAWKLHTAYPERGITSWMAVKRKSSSDPNVFVVPNEENRPLPTRVLKGLADGLRRSNPLARATSRLLRRAAEPSRCRDLDRGIEDFHYPGSWKLLDLLPGAPDVVHCHNLHGGYFDLRALPTIGEAAPVILYLHDAWTLSGHCAYSYGCDRWMKGCGSCPDLTIHPAVRRDATAFNWTRKRDIFARLPLHVATPSRWLMDRVERSLLWPSVADSRVIPYGIDLSVFRPGSRREARDALDVPQDGAVVLLTADGIRGNTRKDYATARAAVEEAAVRLAGDRELLLLALGERSAPERIGRATVRFVPFQGDPAVVAEHYRAADLFLHPAREDNFPNAVLEALGCGTPVVASAVGGVPEQVRSLVAGPWMTGESDPATGILVQAGDSGAMATAIERLLSDEPLREQLGRNGAADARERFSLERYADDFVAWYGEILKQQGRTVAARPAVGSVARGALAGGG
jgi:glycosyltransferase involved in cell wall biosynthesis